MNLLDRIPSLSETETRDAIEHEGENGPKKSSELTSGQIRRAQVRALAGQTRKARRAQIRNFFTAQREAATLRGHLQQVGVISFATPGRKIDQARATSSMNWIALRFGEPTAADVTTFVRDSLQSAFNRYEALNGLPTSQIEWDATA